MPSETNMKELEPPSEKSQLRLALMTFGALAVLVALLVKGVLWLSSVSAQVSVAAEAPAPRFVDPDWPSTEYSEVQAYFYGEISSSLLNPLLERDKAATLPAGVTRARLTPDQGRRLREILTKALPAQETLGCYYPHHAFIFYDGSGKPVAGFEVCFGCGNWLSRPEGLPEAIGLDALKNLVNEVGLPTEPGVQM
jgi:hypothetical protein